MDCSNRDKRGPFLLALCQPPAASRQPPAASRQPPAASRQPPAASRQPPAASRQPPAASGLCALVIWETLRNKVASAVFSA